MFLFSSRVLLFWDDRAPTQYSACLDTKARVSTCCAHEDPDTPKFGHATDFEHGEEDGAQFEDDAFAMLEGPLFPGHTFNTPGREP